MKNSGRINVLVVGGGGREHAMLHKLRQSPRVGELYAVPGNGGIRTIAECLQYEVDTQERIEELAEFVRTKDIKLTVVGPDNPLALGVVDRFHALGLPIIGPTQAAARIEWDKGFAKEQMRRAGIPTAPFRIFHEYDAAMQHARERRLPMVIKVCGLARGKGVYLCNTLVEVEQALHYIMLDRVHGHDNTSVVIEDCLVGREVSVHAFCDGLVARMMPMTRDHKTLYDNSRGPMTGGMGAFGPVRMQRALRRRIYKGMVMPALSLLHKQGIPFSGFLFPGLMLTPAGPMVLEFNARMGDPEAQVLMTLLKTDLLDVLEGIRDHRLHRQKWRRGSAVCVVITASGYPQTQGVGRVEIHGLEEAAAVEGVTIFHSGTVVDGTKVFTAGGRVLSIVAYGRTLAIAHDRAYEAVQHIVFPGMHYRNDIAARALAGA